MNLTACMVNLPLPLIHILVAIQNLHDKQAGKLSIGAGPSTKQHYELLGQLRLKRPGSGRKSLGDSVILSRGTTFTHFSFCYMYIDFKMHSMINSTESL